MKNAFLYLLIASLPFLTSSSCEKKDNVKECPPDVVCTMMFAVINVTVKTAAGAPVTLEEVKTIRKDNSKIITYNQNATTGSYILLDDSYVKSLQNQTDTFIFSGKLNGTEAVHQLFVISADCCHIKKQSGETEIILP